MKERKLKLKNNFKFFQGILPKIIQHHYEEYALLKNKTIKGYFKTLSDVKQASNLIEDGIYSIQKIEIEPKDLGYFSHAML